MTLKELLHLKNITNTRLAEILGVSRHVVQNYLREATPTPASVIEMLEALPARENGFVTRRQFVNLLARLNIDHDDAARCLSKHHDRVERWADISRPMDQRIPLTAVDLRRIEQGCL